MKIPVFHDDQHGTAVVVGAAIINGLKVAGKDPKKVKLVTSGAGAAALACLGLLVKLGIPRENIWVTDLAGAVLNCPSLKARALPSNTGMMAPVNVLGRAARNHA
jgi:malic enzyme